MNLKSFNRTKRLQKPKEIQDIFTYTIQKLTHGELKVVKKDYGMFFTPEPVIDFMIALIDVKKLHSKKEINILEPACGLAQFLSRIKRNLPAIFKKAKLFGVEINKEVINYLRLLDLDPKIELIDQDYLLWEPKISFELIIGNPPYGIPSLSDHYTIKVDPCTKEKYKKLYQTWYGKYNLYGAFIEKSIRILQPEGELIFIIPSTFMILDEFRKLRKFLAENGKSILIYLGSKVFKPHAEVSCLILKFIKSDKERNWLELLEFTDNRLNSIKKSKWEGEIILFETPFSYHMRSICSYKLEDIYDIRISPRTPEIKNNPLVIKGKSPNRQYLPILNSKNLKCDKIIYDNLSGYWIRKEEVKKLRAYFDQPHIVVGLGFRGDGKIAAALDEKCYPWMGDIYHLLRKKSSMTHNFDLSDLEVVDYLNSNYVHQFVKDSYRDITYHLNITLLKNILLPNKNGWEKLKNELSLEKTLEKILENINDIEKLKRSIENILSELYGEN